MYYNMYQFVFCFSETAFVLAKWGIQTSKQFSNKLKSTITTIKEIIVIKKRKGSKTSRSVETSIRNKKLFTYLLGKTNWMPFTFHLKIKRKPQHTASAKLWRHFAKLFTQSDAFKIILQKLKKNLFGQKKSQMSAAHCRLLQCHVSYRF